MAGRYPRASLVNAQALPANCFLVDAVTSRPPQHLQWGKPLSSGGPFSTMLALSLEAAERRGRLTHKGAFIGNTRPTGS